MAHEVFIGYALQDGAVANTICSLLESKGLKCWIAPRDMPPGRFGGAIIEAVSQSKVMVFVFSENSNSSTDCLTQVHTAFTKKKKIITLRIDDTTPSYDLEYYLQLFRWLDAREPPLEKHLQELADRVEKELAGIASKSEATDREQARKEEPTRAKAEEATREKQRREAEQDRARREEEERKKARENERAIREAKEAAEDKERQEAEAARAEAEEAAKEKKRQEAAKAAPALEKKSPGKGKAAWLWGLIGIVVFFALLATIIFIVLNRSEQPQGPTGVSSPEPSIAPTEYAAASTSTPAKPTPPKPPTTPPPATITKPAPYGTIIVASADFSYESTDPIYYESAWGWSMYDQLISWDESGKYVGSVAESWTISPDGNTWTFKIRKGIKFHNGDPLTAADVKFSVDRFGSDESTNPWSYYLSAKYNKVSSAVIDNYTFQYVSKTPEPALVIPFAWTRILPKNYFEKVGQDGFRAHPIGSGPWKFVEHTPKTSFSMEANKDYWGQVPAFQYVKDLMVPEEATRIAMLKVGEVDIALGLSVDNLAKLQKEGWNTVSIGLPTLANINFQGTWLENAGPTHDIRVRQAMSYALNRQEICDTFYKGNAEPGGLWFMQPGCWGWDDSLKPDAYDVAKAKTLLNAANYPKGFPDPVIHIYTTTGATLELMKVCQDYWTKAGIQTRIEILDSAVWVGYFFNFQRMTGTEKNVGWIFPWVFASTQNSIYHASNMYGSWGAHNTAKDPVADTLYNKVKSEFDHAKALQYWTEFQIYAESMYVDVGICMVKPLMVVSKNLGEFTGKNWLSLYDAYNGIQHKK